MGKIKGMQEKVENKKARSQESYKVIKLKVKSKRKETNKGTKQERSDARNK